jgi:Ca-activated chloride channel family protein
LRPSDRVNLIAFGSAPDPRFPSLQPANRASVQALADRFAALDADLGGTELHAALTLAFRQGEDQGGANRRPLDIVLITDGEVWGVEALIAAARRAGHRLFTVGVGTAVAEDLVRGLAEATAGACLLVHPNEGC